MKRFVLLLLVCSVQSSFAQDKAILQKQLTDIMIDFPNKFRNLRDMKDSFLMKTIITGTTDHGIMMIDEKKPSWGYITAPLPIPRSDKQAQELFEKWVEMISAITLNGATLAGKKCDPGLYGLYCYQWNIDNSKNNIATAYIPFKIEVSVIKVGGAIAADLKIGNF